MMRAARMLTTVLGTGFVAIIAGHIVENGDATAARIGASLQSPGMARASVLPDVPVLPRPPIETLQATPLPITRGWSGKQPQSMNISELDRSRFSDVPGGQNCEAQFQAMPSGNGMVRLNLIAPCSINEPVTLRHGGLSFTERSSDTGRLTVEIPAFASNANFEAVMQNGKTFIATTIVPDADNYQRVALVWRGETGLHIHAQEFGAELGSAGHIWAGSPGRPDLGQNGQGGYLTVHGDRKLANATKAEVYTFPANTHASGVVRLSVQAEVENTNCGGMVVAQTLQPDGFGGMIPADLTLRLPECNRVGEHMVLKNILRDLKIASN